MRRLLKQLEDRVRLNSRLAFIALSVFVPRNSGILITCRGKSDGMTAQACAIYSAMLYARATGNHYCHSALHKADHNYENDIDWEQNIERYFSFSLDERVVPDNVKIFNLDRLGSTLALMFLSGFYRFQKRPFLIEKQHYHEYGNRHVDSYADMVDVFRKKFYTGKPLHNNERKSGCLQVACHIRRGDVNPVVYPERFTSNQHIKKQLAMLTAVFTRMRIPYSINIYSQGRISEFEGLSEYGKIILDRTAFEDFQDMVQADILITAKSCFSYCAALLSEGLVIYEPFYHKPLSSWFNCEDQLANDQRFITGIKKQISTHT